MQESLKAWVEDPDDWKLTYGPKPKKKTWSDLLSPYLIIAGFLVVVALLNGIIGE